MAAPNLVTYRDAIEHIIGWAGGQPEEADQNRVRRAVLAAYRHVTSVHSWRYYTRHGRINLVASQSSGTITYSANSRQVTLPEGDTWPIWARYGRITFGSDNNVYKVSERTGDQILTLDFDFAPVADKAALTTYVIYRSEYPLPAGITGIGDMQDEKGDWSAAYVPPEEWMADERHIGGTGTPWHWTVTGGEETYGQMVMKTSRQPTAAGTLDYLYQAEARRLKYDGFARYGNSLSIGTTSSPTQATLGSDVKPGVVGSVLRIADSSATTAPEGEGQNNAFLDQKIITIWTSARVVQVDSEFTNDSYTGKGTISDPIDMAPYMLSFFFRACEHEMAIQLQDSKKTGETAALMYQAMIAAMGRDNLSPPPPSPLSSRGGSMFEPGRYSNVTFE